eukprot:scaffold6921_cov200-Skeletonema_marinoi.AAC.1
MVNMFGMIVGATLRREEIQKHNVKEDNTILLQFRSRDDDEEAAVSSSMTIHHHPKKIEGARTILTYVSKLRRSEG